MGTFQIPGIGQSQVASVLPPISSPPLVSSAMPVLPNPTSPNVVGPGPSQLMIDTAKRDQMANSGSGISQIKNPILRGIAQGADILGSVFTPRLDSLIPGTQSHHVLLMNQQNALINQDQAQQAAATAQQDAQAQVQQRQAQAQQDTAKAQADLDPQKAVDPSKTVQTDDGVYQLNPDTGKYDIRVGDRVDKPKPIEEQAYEYALSKGANPIDAYSQVQGAKTTKDANLPQQYLDAMSSGDTAKAALIRRVIQDTSTAPKIQVMQAAGAERQQEKASALATSGANVDVSSPDAVASLTAVAHGVAPITTLLPRGATAQQRESVVAAIMRINPSFNSGLATAISGTENDAAHGAMARNMTAIRTANDHLTQLGAAATAMQNGNVQALNKIGNAYNVQMGGSAATNFSTVKNAVAGELAKALTGTATVDEIHQMNSDISSAQSPQQIAGVVKTYQALMASKAQEQQRQYQSGKSGGPNFSLGSGGSPSSQQETRTYQGHTYVKGANGWQLQ